MKFNIFNVGDKVRVVKINDDYRSDYIGEIFTIRQINPNAPYITSTHYGVKESNCCHIFYENELELVELAPFTKSDLKDGMVVEHKNGDRALILGGRLVYKDGNRRIENFNDDLTYIISPFNGVEIVRVYTVTSPGGPITNIFRDQYLTLIWERKEEPDHKEMTVAEIEKKLGYKIKVIADKE